MALALADDVGTLVNSSSSTLWIFIYSWIYLELHPLPTHILILLIPDNICG